MIVHSIADAAATVRGRRLDRGLNQAELARRTGVSRKWISDFEAGKPTAEFGLVVRVLEELGLVLSIDDAPAAPATSESLDLDALLEEHRSR